MKYIDYYEVLGVPKTATEKEIKAAYRKLAREHHPDLHQGDAKKAAEEKFKQINEAYEVLGDSDKRAKYDQLGSNWQAGQDFNPPPGTSFHFTGDNMNGSGFSDFFASIFGSDLFGFREPGNGEAGYQEMFTNRRRTKGEEVEAEISLTIEELMAGGEKDIQINLPRICGACGGQRFTRQGVCRSCGGLGVIDETKTIKVKIPAKTYPGTVLRLKGMGGKGAAGAPAGDLYLHIEAATHPAWRVVNQFDLEGDLTIYPEQAVLGDKVSVPTPDGMVQVKIKPGLHTSQKLRLKDKGFKRKNGTFGDLYIKVHIDIPPAQSAAEVELYRQIFALRNQ